MSHDWVEDHHPQFQAALKSFRRSAANYLIQYTQQDASKSFSERPVSLESSLQVGASVARGGDGYAAYRVTAGMIASILDISQTLDATSDFYIELPISGRVFETRNYYNSSHFIDYSHLITKKGIYRPLIPIRIGEKNRKIAHALLEMAFRFIMLHEQMHVVRGHLHYILSADSREVISELPLFPTSSIPTIHRRALELDADSSAMWQLLEFYNDREIILPHFSENIYDEWDWLRIVAVSCLIVMLIFSISDQHYSENGRERLHPSAQARILNLLGLVKPFMRNIEGFDQKKDPPLQLLAMFHDIKTAANTMKIAPPSEATLIEWTTIEPCYYKDPVCIELRELHETFRHLLDARKII